jgi:hypothetical protein
VHATLHACDTVYANVVFIFHLAIRAGVAPATVPAFVRAMASIGVDFVSVECPRAAGRLTANGTEAQETPVSSVSQTFVRNPENDFVIACIQAKFEC